METFESVPLPNFETFFGELASLGLLEHPKLPLQLDQLARQVSVNDVLAWIMPKLRGKTELSDRDIVILSSLLDKLPSHIFVEVFCMLSRPRDACLFALLFACRDCDRARLVLAPHTDECQNVFSMLLHEVDNTLYKRCVLKELLLCVLEHCCLDEVPFESEIVALKDSKCTELIEMFHLRQATRCESMDQFKDAVDCCIE